MVSYEKIAFAIVLFALKHRKFQLKRIEKCRRPCCMRALLVLFSRLPMATMRASYARFFLCVIV